MKIIPKSRTGQFFFFAAETALSYFVIVCNTRAFTQGSYLWTAITDTAFTLQGAIIAKLTIEDKDGRSKWAIAGGAVGGTIGSLLAIYVTKHLPGLH
jgi:hypothetical protein